MEYEDLPEHEAHLRDEGALLALEPKVFGLFVSPKCAHIELNGGDAVYGCSGRYRESSRTIRTESQWRSPAHRSIAAK